MHISNFYEFSNDYSPSSIQVRAEGLSERSDDSGLFDEERLIKGDIKNINTPVKFVYEGGSYFRDIITTGWSSLYLISNKLISVLEQNNFTGWSSFPIEIMQNKSVMIEGYSGLSVNGVCGSIDYEKSTIIDKQLVPGGRVSKYLRGLYVGLDEWDGTDFFLPKNSLSIIVSKEVCEEIKRAQITNVEFRNLEEIEIPSYSIRNQK